MMKKLYYIFILLLFFSFTSYAEDTGRANVRILDFRTYDMVDNVVIGSFEVENPTDYYAPELFYTLSLVPKSFLDANNTIYHSDIALHQSKPQKFSLGAGEIKTISFEYEIYDFLYDEPSVLILEFMNKTSKFFENASTGVFSSGIQKGFLIPADYSKTHYYKIENFEQPLSGPYFEIGKSPEAFINLTSTFDKKVTVTPQFTIYKRLQSYLDSPIDILKGEKITFKPSETKEIKLSLPALNNPESYLVKVTLVDDSNIPVSYQYFFRYVVTGVSAKILDSSTFYSHDEQALGLNLTCVGSADGTPLENVIFSISAINAKTSEKVSSLNETFNLGPVPQQLTFKLPLVEQEDEINVTIALMHNSKILAFQTVPLDKKATTIMKPIFFDVVGTPYENSVKMLNALNIISGYPDGTYKPNNNITRAEFTSIALKLKGINIDTLEKPENIFSDIPDNHWGSKAINIAYQNGIINGYGNNIFKPDNNITYSEALTVLLNVAGFNTDASENASPWPFNYISIAEDLALTKDLAISSYDNFATRGDIAVMTLSAYFIRKV